MQLIWGSHTRVVPADWSHFPQEHAAIEITGVIHGHISLQTADGIWPAATGQVVIIPAHLTHTWVSESGAELAVLHLTHAPLDLAVALTPDGAPRVVTLAAHQFTEYLAVFARLVQLEGQVSLLQERMLHAYIEIFLLVLAEGNIPPSGLAPLQGVVAYMQAHLAERFSITELADHFGVAMPTLRRQFQTAFGTSPKQYLLSLRLAAARHLLATTHLTIQETAVQVGIPNLPHFSALIHHHFGVSPTQLRKTTQ